MESDVIVIAGHFDDGRRLIYCPGCLQAYVDPADTAEDLFQCLGCGKPKPEDVDLEEAFRRGLIMADNGEHELFAVSFRDLLAATLRDVA